MGMKVRDSPSPNGARRQWSREANPKLSSISYTKDDMGAFPSPAQPLWPRQHPAGFISPVMPMMSSLTVVPKHSGAGAVCHPLKSHRLVTPDLDGSV